MSVKLNEIYKCNLCGNVVEIAGVGGGQLVCCGQPMTLQNENTVEASKEKHIPIFEKANGKIQIKVGSVAHPMEEKHYIEWIEIITEKCIIRRYLKHGDKPEAELPTCCNNFSVRAFCNLHGLWKSN